MLITPSMFSRTVRLMVLVLAVTALVSATTGCSWFKKKPRAAAALNAPLGDPNDPSLNGTGPAAPGEVRPDGLNLTEFPEGTVRTIYFDYDKASIRGDQSGVLDGNLKYLQEHPEIKVYIEGHCDERGTVEYNFALGHRRGAAMRDYFLDHGITPERIAVASKGSEQPAVPGHSEQAWRMNRRAEFKQMN